MSISLPNTLDKCGECRADFYGDHLEGCLKEEALETCGECESFYVREESPYARPCRCEEETGECDTCQKPYELASRWNRCGECGDCGECCEHAKEWEAVNV